MSTRRRRGEKSFFFRIEKKERKIAASLFYEEKNKLRNEICLYIVK
jgi:hypothetical protein